MTVFHDAHDHEPALYVTTWAPSKASGPLILRSLDGKEFTPVPSPELNSTTISAYRSLISFNNRLYMAPTAQVGGKANIAGRPLILSSETPASGEWQLANEPGFGDPTNLTIFDLAVFDDCLYAGTLNPSHGYQVWKTHGGNRNPHHWTRVITDGAYRGPLNEAVVSMCVFRGALYIGSGIQNGGYDRAHRIGPAAAELIRIHPDNSWDLIVGEARTTPDGYKRALSHFGPGFDNVFNGYFWRMTVYDGCLYLGTFDWSVLLPFLASTRGDTAVEKVVKWLGTNNLVHFEAGFDLFCSPDGVRWQPITTDGFANPYNYGARTLVGTPYGLFVGAANPFGPEVAMQHSRSWSYVHNPRGGAEVWWGKNRSWGNNGK
jgi:hypothetical protein